MTSPPPKCVGYTLDALGVNAALRANAPGPPIVAAGVSWAKTPTRARNTRMTAMIMPQEFRASETPNATAGRAVAVG